MVECPDQLVLERYVHGLSDPGEAEAIERHRQECPSCASWLGQADDDESLLNRLREHRRDGIIGTGLLDRPLHESIPGYTIARELGRGGQGVVYEATQLATRRRVAIKAVLAGSFATPRERARFQREVQLLASLRHPNVVAVHDSGEAGACLYSVMDFVEGRPLDVALSESPLEPPRLLDLFARICDAVAAAHIRGIMHRDLKPSNILVDAEGEPRVMDFGLGRSTLPGADATVTVAGQFMGSLAWASPEQVAGDDASVDIRTDVYSLGVMLYEALTGRRPYDTSMPLAGAVDNIRRSSPVPPSRLRRGLSREIDAIVLHCLAKEPAGRYDSASALARDIRAFLERRPVEAMSGERWYVARAALRRYRVPVAIAAIAGVALCGFSIAMWVMYQQAERSRQFANSQGSNLLAEMRVRDKSGALLSDMREQLNRADSGHAEILELAVKRANAQLANDEESRSIVLVGIADAFDRFGHPGRARGLRVEAVRLIRALGYEHPRLVLRALATGSRFIAAGDPALAEELLLAISPNPRPPAFDAELNRLLAAAALARGDTERAKRHSDIAVRFLEQTPRLNPDRMPALRDRARILERLGDPDADEPLRQAIALCRERPRVPAMLLHEPLHELGALLLRQDRPREAVEPLRESLRLRCELFGEGSDEAKATAALLAEIESLVPAP